MTRYSPAAGVTGPRRPRSLGVCWSRRSTSRPVRWMGPSARPCRLGPRPGWRPNGYIDVDRNGRAGLTRLSKGREALEKAVLLLSIPTAPRCASVGQDHSRPATPRTAGPARARLQRPARSHALRRPFIIQRVAELLAELVGEFLVREALVLRAGVRPWARPSARRRPIVGWSTLAHDAEDQAGAVRVAAAGRGRLPALVRRQDVVPPRPWCRSANRWAARHDVRLDAVGDLFGRPAGTACSSCDS